MTPEALKQYRLFYIKAHANKMSGGEIAAALGVTRNVVAGICGREGIRLTAHKQPAKDVPMGTRQNGALSVNFEKKVKHTTASSNGRTPDFDSGNAGSNPDAAAKPKPNYAINHPILYKGIEKSTHSKPIPESKVKTSGSGVWASGGCLAVIGAVKDKRGCCAETVDGVYCAAHNQAYRTHHVIRVGR